MSAPVNAELDSIRRKKTALYASMLIVSIMVAIFILYYLGATFQPLNLRFDIVIISFVPLALISSLCAFYLNRREVLTIPLPMRIQFAKSYFSSSMLKFVLSIVLFLFLYIPYTMAFVEYNLASTHVEREVTGSEGLRFSTNDPLHFTDAVSITVEVESGSLHAALFEAEAWDSGLYTQPIFEKNITGKETLSLIINGETLEPGEYVFELSTDGSGSNAKIGINREISKQMVKAIMFFSIFYGIVCGASAAYFSSIKRMERKEISKKIVSKEPKPAFSEVHAQHPTTQNVIPSADSHLQRIQYGPPQVKVTIQNVPAPQTQIQQNPYPQLSSQTYSASSPEIQPQSTQQRTQHAQQPALPRQVSAPQATQSQAKSVQQIQAQNVLAKHSQIPSQSTSKVPSQNQPTHAQQHARVSQKPAAKVENVSVVTPEMQRARLEEQRRRKEAVKSAELELKKKLEEEERRRQETEARIRAAEEEAKKLEKARLEAEAELRAKLEAAEKERAAEEAKRVELELKMKRSEEEKLRAELELQRRLLEEERRKLEEMKRLEAQREQSVMNDVFLIHRDGRLICHNTRRLKPDVDNDILTGMFTAVTNFVRDTFKEETKGELNELKYGDLNIFLEYGKHVYLAVVLQGLPPDDLRENMREIIGIIERRFSPVLEEWDGTMTDIADVKEIVKAIFTGSISKHLAEGPVVYPKGKTLPQIDFSKDIPDELPTFQKKEQIEEPIEEPVPVDQHTNTQIEEPEPIVSPIASEDPKPVQTPIPQPNDQTLDSDNTDKSKLERKIKNVKCPKCSQTFPADVTVRPARIECPSCGTTGTLK
ncbi:MAG: hypothetical protein QXT63_04105 [Thermoplasmata archaeon]